MVVVVAEDIVVVEITVVMSQKQKNNSVNCFAQCAKTQKKVHCLLQRLKSTLFENFTFFGEFDSLWQIPDQEQVQVWLNCFRKLLGNICYNKIRDLHWKTVFRLHKECSMKKENPKNHFHISDQDTFWQQSLKYLQKMRMNHVDNCCYKRSQDQ